MSNFVKFCIWLLLTILIVELITVCLNAPSTILACIGFLLIVAWIVISYKTKTFTTIFKNKKQ